MMIPGYLPENKTKLQILKLREEGIKEAGLKKHKQTCEKNRSKRKKK